MTDQQHSPWGPSGAERWMVCHASVKEGMKAPKRPPTHYQAEGSHAHKLLEYCLINQIERVRDCTGMLLVPAEGPVTEEMCDAVQEMVDEVHYFLKFDPNAQWWVEVTVHIPTPNNPDDCWGTADVVIWLPALRILVVLDYKHGAGIAKDAEDNPQAKSYAAGVLFGEPLRALLGAEPLCVVIGIVQPRAFHPEGPVRYWETTPDVLREWIPQLDEAITATKGDNPQYVVDEDVCRFCAGHLTCRALEAKALSLAGDAFKDVRAVQPKLLPAPEQVGLDHVAYVLQAGGTLKQWLKSFEEYALEQARAGVYVPGHKVVHSSQRRAYPKGKHAETAEEIIKISENQLTLDDVYPRTLLGLTDMEKLLKTPPKGGNALTKIEKKRRSDLFAFVAPKQVSPNVSLVPESDKRPAVNMTQLAFSNVTVPPTQT